MKKMSRVFALLLVIFLISSFTMVTSFAWADSSLNLTSGSYVAYEYNSGVPLYFTKSRSIGINFSAYNSEGNFSIVNYQVFGLEGFDVGNILGPSRTLISNRTVYISQSSYSETFQYELPELPAYDQQGAFEIRAIATGTNGGTMKIIRVVYSEKDYAVVNIAENIPNPYSGTFTLSADIYDLSSVGLSNVKVGIYRDNIPVMYYSRDVYFYNNGYNKYRLNCTLSTDSWSNAPGAYGNCFKMLKNGSNSYQPINGDYFIIP